MPVAAVPVRIAGFATALLCLGLPARAADEPGSKDHPLVGRYQASEIAYYKAGEYDETGLLRQKLDTDALLDGRSKNQSGPEWMRLEGRVTRIRYTIPEGRSSLEVFRNYQQSLTSRGFTVAFTCTDQACFTGKLDDPYLLGQEIDRTNNVSTAYFDHARYLLAQANTPGGPTYVAALVGESNMGSVAFIEVVETKAIEDDKIAIMNAGDMGAAIARERKVDLYGILFDFDRAEVKPDSRPTLEQIAGMMRAQPELRLEVVGHTDDVGRPDYNLNLSARRAASVVAALVESYGVAPDRLSSSGAGQTMPVAPNTDEPGRAKNRRVELRGKN